MISMQTPFLSYIWLTILVCLATCNYDLANGVNPFDTNFFKVKRRNSKDNNKFFLPSLNPLQKPIDNNYTRTDLLKLSLMDSNRLTHDRYNHRNPGEHRSHLEAIEATSDSFSTTASHTSFSYNNNVQQPNDGQSIRNKAIAYAQSINNQQYNHHFEQLPFESSQSLNCEPKVFPQLVVNTDEQGRQCRGTITPQGCWGRCDTGEYADWRFPFKKSFHRVCIHKLIRIKQKRLRDCDDGVDESLRWYRYLNAESCACQICKSSEVSCEGLSYFATTAPFNKKDYGPRFASDEEK